MKKFPESIITKTGKTESYYDYLLSKYIAPSFTLFFRKLKIGNPNVLTYCSFFILLLSGFLTLNLNLLSSPVYRVIIGLLIQMSFIFDCSDGQLARLTGKTSKLGGWLDKVLDRVGEFIIFSLFGYVEWQRSTHILSLFFGIFTGYCLLMYTLAMAISETCLLENIVKVSEVRRMQSDEKNEKKRGDCFKHTLFAQTVSKIFFFLNFGIGERYLYLSFFMIIDQIGVMLYITSLLSFLRMISISYHVGRSLRKTDKLIKELHE